VTVTKLLSKLRIQAPPLAKMNSMIAIRMHMGNFCHRFSRAEAPEV
jgi:hypothetical protein